MLKAVNLRSGYGALQVVNGVSLRVQPGEIVALIGANGAGKSTLLKTLAGVIHPTEGRVLLRDQPVAGWPAHQLARRGLVLVPEGRALFPGMTVLDNLRLGGYPKKLAGPALAGRIEAMCEQFPALREKLRQRAGELSGGQRQMLAIARALISEPEILLLDEPSTGLAPLLVAEIFECIRQLQQAGISILLAEQNVQGTLRIAQRAYVMQTGRIVLDGPAADLLRSEQVQKAYLGK
jgi:branched-chain amino acid transport system ATP-binding protein